MMHGREKSDPAIVAKKPANKVGRSAAELVEPRAGTEGNANQNHTCRAQNRGSVSQGLERVRQLAKQHKKSKRHFVAAWTELKPVSKVMSVTSSGGDYFGHTEFATIEPQGPTELHTGVPTASCRRGVRAGYFGGQARAGARTESQYGVQVAPATAGGPV
jgi:hypothetical protein